MDKKFSFADNGALTERQLDCNSCKRLTRHELIAGHSVTISIMDSNDMEIGQLKQNWEMLQCRGCNTITVRVETQPPTVVDELRDYRLLGERLLDHLQTTGRHDLERALNTIDEVSSLLEQDTQLSSVPKEKLAVPVVEFYPPRTARFRAEKKYQTLPDHLRGLYREVIAAINNGSPLLCAAGIRALLEGICEHKEITEGPNQQGKMVRTLEGKINSLSRLVPSGIVSNLHGLRFLGNQALHELEVPLRADLELSLDVIEDILNVVYDLDYRSRLLAERFVPPLDKPEYPDDDNTFARGSTI